MRKLVAAVWFATLLLSWSPSASGVGFTISSSLPFTTTNGVIGTINPVTDLSGTAICTGTCGTSLDHDWLVITVTLSNVPDPVSDPVGQIGISVPGVATITGAGYFTDPGKNVTGVSSSASAALFNYSHLIVSAQNLQPGETTDRLFVAFSLGSLPGPGLGSLPPGTGNFMFHDLGTNAAVQHPIAAIPEPGTLALLGAGLLGLGLTSRRRV